MRVMDARMGGLAQQFPGRVVEYPAGGGVDVQHVAIAIQAENPLEHAVENGAQVAGRCAGLRGVQGLAAQIVDIGQIHDHNALQILQQFQISIVERPEGGEFQHAEQVFVQQQRPNQQRGGRGRAGGRVDSEIAGRRPFDAQGLSVQCTLAGQPFARRRAPAPIPRCQAIAADAAQAAVIAVDKVQQTATHVEQAGQPREQAAGQFVGIVCLLQGQ